MAAVLTPVQTKQIRINIHKRNNTKTQYTYYQNNHTLPRWCNSTFSLISMLGGSGWSTSLPGRLTPGKGTRYTLYRGLSGPQERKRKIYTSWNRLSPLSLRTVQSHHNQPRHISYNRFWSLLSRHGNLSNFTSHIENGNQTTPTVTYWTLLVFVFRPTLLISPQMPENKGPGIA